jgi:prophage regulatory protein
MTDQVRFLRLPRVEDKCGLKRDSIYRKAKLGQFPKPVKIGDRASAWLESEIDEWCAKRLAERDASSAA